MVSSSKTVTSFVLLTVLLGLTFAGRHSIYSGFAVHSVWVSDWEQATALQQLIGSLDLDTWQEPAPGVREGLIMTSPEKQNLFLNELDIMEIQHSLHVGNVERLLEQQDLEWSTWKRARNGEIEPFNDYPRYEEVDEYMEQLARDYPTLVQLVTAGTSFEGREIKYLLVSTTQFANTSKPVYFLDAMIHAREWVTTPITLYTLHRLLEDRQPEDEDLLQNIDWIVMPIVNPDGYEYTHTDERLWRRTRSIRDNTTCVGTDANRNFDVLWNTLGVSSNPCSNTYPGVSAFSEPETVLVRDILFEYLDRIQIYLNIHSHGNYVLFGFGDGSLPPNTAALHAVGAAFGAAVDAVKLPQAPFYLVGNSALSLYATSGSAQDYAQSIGVPFSYTLELPGLGYGFQVPADYLSQINAETWRGIAASARLAHLFYTARNNS